MELNCRACLQVEDVMVHIDEEVDELNSNLAALLEQCGGLKIKCDDSFPKYLCKECISELLIAAKFRDKCTKTQKILDQIEAESQSVPSTDEPLTQQKENIIENSPAIENNITQPKYFLVTDENNETQLVTQSDCDPDLFTLVENSNLSVSSEVNAACLYASIVTGDDSANMQATNIDNANTFSELSTNNNHYLDYDTEATGNLQTSSGEFVLSEKDFNSDIFAEPLVTSGCYSKFPYVCDICGASFVNVFNLKRHFEKTHSLLELYSCVKCDLIFSMEPNYVDHCKECNGSEDVGSEKDPNSQLQTESASTVLLPKNTKKSKIDQVCEYCDKRFLSVFALNMHLRVHTGERPFGCEICGKSYKTKSALATHLKRHVGQAEYQCSVCNKTFYETSNLTNHLRTHTGEKPHACTVCQKRFSRVYLLQLHMRTHTGEKPYQCKYCDRAFAQPTDLRYHTASMHTKSWHYKCEFCPKAFGKKKTLMAHLQTHSTKDQNIDVTETATSLGPIAEEQVIVDNELEISNIFQIDVNGLSTEQETNSFSYIIEEE